MARDDLPAAASYHCTPPQSRCQAHSWGVGKSGGHFSCHSHGHLAPGQWPGEHCHFPRPLAGAKEAIGTIGALHQDANAGVPLPDRFYCLPPLALGEVRLEGSEAHHLLHVLRAKPGLAVVLFDGSGVEFDATVERTERTAVVLRVTARRELDREPAMRVMLGVAMPKGDRQRWLVEKATELGVARLVPLTTERGVAQPAGAAIVRFRRSVIEAAKQCGRNQLMEIGDAESVGEFCAGAPTDAARLIAHPCGATVGHAIATASGKEIRLAIGPEGGFSDAEVQQAIDCGWQAVNLGRRILRTETAATAFVARVVVE